MTLINVPLTFYPVTLAASGGTGGVFSSNSAHSLIDAAGERFAYVFRAPKTGNIDRISFRTATVTTGASVDVRLETVDATTGDPTGTLVNANANVTVAIADVDDNTWFEATLTAVGAVTQGTAYALVIEAPGGYAGVILFAYYTSLTIGPSSVVSSYIDSYLTGAWVKKAASFGPVFRVRYDDATYPYMPDVCSALTLSEYIVSTATTPDEIGILLTVPKCRTLGFWCACELDDDATIKLYNTDGSTVLGSYDLDKDIREGVSHGVHIGRWAAPQTLTSGALHRLTFLPTTASGTARPAYMGFSDAAHRSQMGLALVQKTSRTDAGAWTEDATEIPFMGLLIDQLDDGAGGGGGGSCRIIGG